MTGLFIVGFGLGALAANALIDALGAYLRRNKLWPFNERNCN